MLINDSVLYRRYPGPTRLEALRCGIGAPHITTSSKTPWLGCSCSLAPLTGRQESVLPARGSRGSHLCHMFLNGGRGKWGPPRIKLNQSIEARSGISVYDSWRPKWGTLVRYHSNLPGEQLPFQLFLSFGGCVMGDCCVGPQVVRSVPSSSLLSGCELTLH